MRRRDVLIAVRMITLQLVLFIIIDMATKAIAHPGHDVSNYEPYQVDAAVIGVLSALYWFGGSISALIEALVTAPGYVSAILNMLGAIATGVAVVLQSPLSISHMTQALWARFF